MVLKKETGRRGEAEWRKQEEEAEEGGGVVGRLQVPLPALPHRVLRLGRRQAPRGVRTQGYRIR